LAVTFVDSTPSLPARLHQAAAALLAWAEARHLRAALVLAVLASAAFLPGIAAIPPTDRDESRYAQATRQMLQTGDLVDIRLQDEPRHKKPIGIYWMQAAAATVTGHGANAPIWVYRVPSLLGAVAGVLLTYWALFPLIGRRAALLAGMLTAGTVLLGVEARLAKTDAALFGLTVGAMGALIRAFLDPERTRASYVPWLFWALIGLGVLVKGPIAPLVAGSAAALLSLYARDWRWLKGLRPGWGALLAAGIALPWFVAIAITSNWGFFERSLGVDLLPKLVEAAEQHWGPPGYHVGLFPFIAWPLAPFALLAAAWVWANRRRREVVVLAAWAAPLWVVSELIQTKLPHYTLPVYPALAGLAAAALVAGAGRVRGLWTRLLTGGLWAFPLGLVLVAMGALIYLEGRIPPGLALFGPLAVGAGVAAAAVARRELVAAVPLAAGAAVLLSAGVFGAAVPGLQTVWLSQRMAEAVRATAACPEPRLASAAYHEPSLVLLTRTDTMLASGAMAAEFLAGAGCRMAFVDAAPARAGADSEEDAFRRRAAELGVRVEQVAMVEGRNMNAPRLRRMGLWRAAR
jgi:4-amino-4-deoxy-L-arabinose transferase-like glycosyltransferase